MAHRWKGLLKVSSGGNSRRAGRKEFRVFASLACSSPGSLLVPARNAIFFVGDRVTDSGNATVERLSRLENIAAALLPKLGQAVNLWIVEPSHYMGPFACYENILPSLTASGEPMGFYKPKGLPAARACVSILKDCLAQVNVKQLCSQDKDATAADLKGKEKASSDGCIEKEFPFEPFLDPVRIIPPTILLGFSKGGIVLNQMLAEIVHSEESLSPSDLLRLSRCTLQDNLNTPEKDGAGKRSSSSAAVQLLPSTAEDFLSSIEEVHYVDVGLNCQGAYQTDPRVLEGLAKIASSRDREGLYVGIHGTPRQWQCNNRRWIAMEKDRCVALLEQAARKYGGGKLRVSERLYFRERSPDLQMHFEVIEALVLREDPYQTGCVQALEKWLSK